MAKTKTVEDEKISRVKTRFSAMQQARTVVDKDWGTYQEMIDAIFVPYPDERSSSVVPLASSIIELFVAEALKLQTEYKFKAETTEFSTQAKALEYVWKYDFRKRNRKKDFIENEYIAAGFGTAVMYTGYESYDKIQKDIEFNDIGNIIETEKTIKKNEIIVKNIDIRDFYIDNQATSIEDASDCILRQWISFERFQNYKNNKLYNNIDKVKAKGYSNEYHSFTTQEENSKEGDYVELLHYWNVETDNYIVVANGVLVRDHAMISTIDGEKALPFVIRPLGYKNYSIYGRGICEALMTFNSEVNNLRELIMDAIRRSNSQVLAIGNGLEFDGRTFSYDNEILTFNGQLAGNFEQISGNGPNSAIFSYLTQLYKDIAIYVGIDIQNIIGQPQQTAFQTEVQREASQKRVNVWLTNRDLAFERFANLYKDLLQKFFPKKDAEGVYPKIEIEGQKLIEEGDKKKFVKKKGKSVFEVTPEILRGSLTIDVHTNLTAPTINAVDRAQKLEMVNSLANIAQGYAVAKQAGFDIEKILPINKTIEDIASDYNLEVTANGGGDVEDALGKLRDELMGMRQQPQQIEQPLSPNMQQGAI